MNITKYHHACLLVETPEKVAIFDPGNFSWQSGLFSVDALERLDYIVITHEHPDHFEPAFVRALKDKFPEATVVATKSIVAWLAEMGITKNVSDQSNDDVVVFSRKPHADLSPIGLLPAEHIAVHYLNHLTHCGDRHDIEESKAVLALPVTAPWGSTSRAAAMALELKPKTIIPIHDWLWRDEFRVGMYDRLEAFFKEHEIRFVKPVGGEPFEV